MHLIDILCALMVVALPGPLLLAIAMPQLFAPRGKAWAACALYGGVWGAAKLWMQLSPTFVG